ncbi:hypothetical protein D9M68_873540 [compost metagenome]
MLLQGIEDAFQQHIGGGDQRIRPLRAVLQQRAHLLVATGSAELLAVADADEPGETVQRLMKAALARLAYRQLRACAEQRDMSRRRAEQAAG